MTLNTTPVARRDRRQASARGVVAGSPAATARRLIIASTTRRPIQVRKFEGEPGRQERRLPAARGAVRAGRSTSCAPLPARLTARLRDEQCDIQLSSRARYPASALAAGGRIGRETNEHAPRRNATGRGDPQGARRLAGRAHTVAVAGRSRETALGGTAERHTTGTAGNTVVSPMLPRSRQARRAVRLGDGWRDLAPSSSARCTTPASTREWRSSTRSGCRSEASPETNCARRSAHYRPPTWQRDALGPSTSWNARGNAPPRYSYTATLSTPSACTTAMILCPFSTCAAILPSGSAAVRSRSLGHGILATRTRVPRAGSRRPLLGEAWSSCRDSQWARTRSGTGLPVRPADARSASCLADWTKCSRRRIAACGKSCLGMREP